MINVVLLGAGNVGTHLYRALHKANNIRLVQWYNRSSGGVNVANNQVNMTNDLNCVAEADLYLVAVTDSALPEISQAIGQRKGVIAHTAGSISMNELNDHENHGVFYPLQTFSKQKQLDFSQIPLCLEANSEENLALLKKVASALGGPIHLINSSQRKALHIAAVFVNNFVNHLYTIGSELCEEQQLPFDVLLPLIQETANKINSLAPQEAQTGPAKRGDKIILNEHLKQLNNPKQREIYTLLSAAIQHHG